MADSAVKVWRFFIHPQTNIRTTQNDNWMFDPRIKDSDLLDYGRKKTPTKPAFFLNKKKKILKYWDWKRAVKLLATLQKFDMPESGAYIKFFIPMPVSWSQKKKNERCFKLHQQTPDADNLVKALLDGLMAQDCRICDYRVSKFWYDGKGHIEITTGELTEANGYQKFKFTAKDEIK